VEKETFVEPEFLEMYSCSLVEPASLVTKLVSIAEVSSAGR